MIQIKDLIKIYSPKKGQKYTAINNISINFPNKGMIFITGPSGSGKSTLLNIIGGLDKSTKGKIIVNNQDITKYNEKQLTKYRENNIGFVFQDFNLLDELNVYDNIAITLKNTKQTKKIVSYIIQIIGLKGMEKRKVYELSGGEKQRVAIARAIVKNPSIILADEPTGNLDSNNSNQIFQLLKVLSKNCLVIVVTHDITSALKYADGIVKIKDGKILFQNVNLLFEQILKKKKKLKKSLNIKSLFHLSLEILKSKKIKVLITSLLVIIAFTMFGFSMALLNFNIYETHADTLINEDINEITISKEYNQYTIENSLFPKDIQEIIPKIESNYYIQSKLFANNELSYIEYGYNPKNENLQEMAYYSLDIRYNTSPNIITYNNEQLNSLNILGTIPNNQNEILIPELLAEHYIVKGLKIYNDSNKKNPEITDLNVNNFNELLNQKIWLGNTFVTIKGIIIDENLKKYELLKSMTVKEANIKENKLYEEFQKYYEDNYQFIVNENFFDISTLKNNNILSQDIYKLYYTYNNQDYYEMNYTSLLDEKITYYNGKDYITTDKIDEGNIIISSMLLDEILEYQISQKIKEEALKAKEQEKTSHNDSNNIINEEIPPINIDEISRKIRKEVVKEKNIIGSTITFNILDENEIVEEEKKAISLTIIGYHELEESIYSIVSDEFIEYRLPNNLVTSINIKENNKETIEKIFLNFPTQNSNFISKTKFSNQMLVIENLVKRIEKISKYIAAILLLFAILLFGIFILNSVLSNKRKIGILKSLGTSSFNITKIFITESLIIGTLTFIISSFLTIFSINTLNNYITQEFSFYVKPIIFDINIVYYILIIIVLSIFINFVIPIAIIFKSQPSKLLK